MKKLVTFKLKAGKGAISAIANVPGLMSQGRNVAEAIKASESALKLYSKTTDPVVEGTPETEQRDI